MKSILLKLKVPTQPRSVIAGCASARLVSSRLRPLLVVFAIFSSLAAHRAAAVVLDYDLFNSYPYGQESGNWDAVPSGYAGAWWNGSTMQAWVDGNTAQFSSYFTNQNAIVYLHGNRTVSGLIKNDSAPNGGAYTVITSTNASDTLTLQNSSVITVNNQWLSLQSCVVAGTNVVVNGNGGVLELGSYNRSDTVANTISGLTLASGQLTTVLLDKANNVSAVSGNIAVNGGTLQFDSNNEIGASATLTINGGTVNLNGTSQTLSSLTALSASPVQSSGVSSLTLNGTSGNALTYGGGATSANISYTLGSASAQSVWFNATNNGTAVIGGTMTFAGGTKTFNIDDGFNAIDMQLGGDITQTATSSLIKTGNGTLELDGNNTYTGATTVSAGTLLGLTGGSCSNSAMTVSAASGNAAALGVTVTDNTKQWTIPGLTVNNGGTSSDLQFRFNVVPGANFAPLKVNGNVTFTTTPGITIIGGGGLPVSSGNGYPLMSWSGSGPATTNGMTLTLPSGAVGSLAIVSKTLYLKVTTGIATGAAEAVYYVAPTGSDANPGSISQPFQTLSKAQAAVRTINKNMTGDIIIYLRGGNYTLTNTLTFGPGDGGNSGYNVIYEAYQSEVPVINGGKAVSGWTLHDAAKNIWQASVGATDNFRQIYVGGIKATRAWGPPPANYVTNATGFSTTDTNLQYYGNITNLEVVGHPDHWLQERYPVLSITNGTNITFQQPCWGVMTGSSFLNLRPYNVAGSGEPLITRMENAYEFMNTPGFWYLNLYTHTLYYIPHSWENLSNTTVEVPVVEQLFSLSGTEDNPVSNLEFVGLNFRLANWLQPSTGYGMPGDQANQVIFQPEPGTNWAIKAAVDCTGANNVLVSGCTFHQLSGDGVNFLVGCHGDTVTNCLFYDIGASAVQVGRGVWDDAFFPVGSANIVSNITVASCVVHDIGTDYQAACGLYFGFVAGCTVAHNEIFDVPYSGMSLGWGWANFMLAPYAAGNQIIGNKVHDHMQALIDGGGIYCNGWETNGVINGNYIYNQGGLPTAGEIYLDDGSYNWAVTSNLCILSGSVSPTYWAISKGASDGSGNNVLNGNFTDNDIVGGGGGNGSYEINTTVISSDSGSWPAAATAIANASGPVNITNNPPANSGVFANPYGGIWEASTNWSSDRIASGSGQTGDFSGLTLPMDTTVTFDASLTIGNLIFADEGAAHNWILNGVNYVNGVSGGALTLAGSSPTITVSNQTTIIEMLLAGNNGLTKNGAGTLVLTAGNTYTGGTTVSNGRLIVQNNIVPGSTLSIASGATLEYNDDSPVTQGASGTLTLSGAGTLQKTGAGTLTFGSGQTINWNLGAGALIDVQAGTLVGGNYIEDFWTNNLASLNVASGATFDGVEANVCVDALTGGGTINSGYSGAGYVNFTFGVNNGSGTFSGVLADSQAAGSFVKVGAGTQILSGINTYTGATTVNQGTLLGMTGGSCSNSAMTVSATSGNAAALGVVVTDNTKQWTIPSLTVNNGGASSGLQFNFAVTPSTNVAPLNVTGNVNLTTTPGITIATSVALPVSSGNGYPLMTWGGSGPANANGMTLTLLSSGAGNLAVVGNTLYLQVTATIIPILSYSPLGSAGQESGNWDDSGVWWNAATGFGNWVDGDIAQFYSATNGQNATVHLNGNGTISGLQKWDYATNGGVYTAIVGSSPGNTLTFLNGSTITVNNQWLSLQGCVVAGTNVMVDLTGSSAVFELGSYGNGDTVANTLSGLTITGDSVGTVRLDKAANVTAVSGNIAVNGGILQFDTNNELGAGTTLTVNGGGISLGLTSQSLSSFTGASAGSVTLAIDRAAGTGTYGRLTGMTTASLGGTLAVTSLGGAFQPGDSFTLIVAASYTNNFTATNLPALPSGQTWNWNPTNGTLFVVGTPSNVVAVESKITTSVSGNVLTLSWPTNYAGWTLESCTNALNIGLSGTWYPVGGSSVTNSVSITIDPKQPGVFYRLVNPYP